MLKVINLKLLLTQEVELITIKKELLEDDKDIKDNADSK